MIVLEDCHWIGPLARDLLTALVRRRQRCRCCSCSPTGRRPRRAAGSDSSSCRSSPSSSSASSSRHDAEQLIRSKLGAALRRRAEASPRLVELVTARSQGNPFYVEELLNYVHGQGVDPQDEAACARLELPESLHSLILSRVDTLGEAPRRTLKVASVVGRSFLAPSLPGVYPELGPPDDVGAHLATLRSLDLITLDQDAEQSYIFKHVVTQEVAYESMPFSIRAMLHERVGDYIEADGGRRDRTPARPARAPLLAQREPRRRSASTSFGPARRPRRATRTRPPSTISSALSPLVGGGRAGRRAPEARQGPRARGRLAPRRGGRARGARERPSTLGDARARAWCETALAEVARKQGRYDEALSCSSRPPEAFESVGDDSGVAPGSAPRWARSPPSRASTRRRSRATRRAWRSASASTTRPAWPACSRTSASSPNTAATTQRRADTTSRRSRSGRSSTTAGRSRSR